MTEPLKPLDSYHELLALIERSRIWTAPAPDEYDLGSVAHILGACADNLRSFALAAELEDLHEFLGPSQIEFLVRLGRIREHAPAQPSE